MAGARLPPHDPTAPAGKHLCPQAGHGGRRPFLRGASWSRSISAEERQTAIYFSGVLGIILGAVDRRAVMSPRNDWKAAISVRRQLKWKTKLIDRICRP
jgi:hypothetical protein